VGRKVFLVAIGLIDLPPDPAQRLALDEVRRLLMTDGPRLLRLQAQQQAALQLLQARRLGADDATLRATLDGVVHQSLQRLVRS
jgi:hypothetical protein